MPRAVRGRESTGVVTQDPNVSLSDKFGRVTESLERVATRQESFATREELRKEVTGARQSIELAAAEKFVDARLFAEYRTQASATEARLTGDIARYAAALAIATAPKPPKETPWLSIIGLVVALAGPIVVVVWNAARYPERTEFRELEARINAVEKEDSKRDARVQDVRDLATRVLDRSVTPPAPQPAGGHR